MELGGNIQVPFGKRSLWRSLKLSKKRVESSSRIEFIAIPI
jgi:hypothetical protein